MKFKQYNNWMLLRQLDDGSVQGLNGKGEWVDGGDNNARWKRMISDTRDDGDELTTKEAINFVVKMLEANKQTAKSIVEKIN